MVVLVWPSASNFAFWRKRSSAPSCCVRTRPSQRHSCPVAVTKACPTCSVFCASSASLALSITLTPEIARMMVALPVMKSRSGVPIAGGVTIISVISARQYPASSTSLAKARSVLNNTANAASISDVMVSESEIGGLLDVCWSCKRYESASIWALRADNSLLARRASSEVV